MAEKKIKIEKSLNDLDSKIKTFEEKEKKFDHKIDLLKGNRILEFLLTNAIFYQ